MTNSDAFDILQRWADKNMPHGATSAGPDLGRIFASAGATSDEFAKFMPKKPHD